MGMKNQNTRITIKQVAEEVGLSITIVSQVLNNRPCRVSAEKRKLIESTARKMNYRPNQVAVGLVKGQRNLIGLAISDIRNSFFVDLAKGVEDETRKNGWNLLLCNSNDNHKTELDNIQTLADQGVSGIILGLSSETTEEKGAECIHLLEKERIPYILVDTDLESNTSGFVSLDHEMGGYMAARYLLESGHKNLICITGPAQLIATRQRLNGVKRACEECGHAYGSVRLIEGKYTYDSGRAAAERIIREYGDVNAIFAFNDLIAIGAMQVFQEKGYRIPEDLSVIGYDDIATGVFLPTPLSTIHQPAEEIGKIAAECLITNPAGGNVQNKKILLQPRLIRRKSVMATDG